MAQEAVLSSKVPDFTKQITREKKFPSLNPPQNPRDLSRPAVPLPSGDLTAKGSLTANPKIAAGAAHAAVDLKRPFDSPFVLR